MNKEYMMFNGKTIVSTDNDGLKVIPNYENPEEVLKQENLVETIDNLIKVLLERKENTKLAKVNITKHLSLKICLIAVPLLLGFIFRIIFGLDLSFVTTKLGTISLPEYLSIAMAYGFIISDFIELTIGRYFDKKDCQRKRDAYDSSIEYLQKRKAKEEKILYDMKQHNKVEGENKVNVNSVKIHDPEALSEIERFILINYRGRLNLKKYYRRYLQGNLQFTLEKEKELNNLDYYIDFIEEKGPKLIKNFKTSDKY
ncbi:MAG: hypothetical protein J6X02_00365 [Bacilli bacterium]|nr:hypothetical protein [Bacilli bacterium]